MSYTKITTSFKDHETVLTAAHLQHLESGIADNDAALVNRVRTDTNAQGLGTSQKRNARTNIDAPSTAEMAAAVAAEADLRSAADAAMETKTDGILDEVEQAKEDITDLQAVSSSMVKTKTVSGNPLTIKDALAGKVKKLVLRLEPKQSMNGYSKPWIGGFGKNLASPVTDSNGWSINVGGSFSVNGDILAVETTTAVSSGVYAKSGSVLRNILTSLSGQYTWSIDVKASASISAAIGVQGIAMRNNVTIGTSWARISGTGTFNATSVPFVIYNNGSTAATIEARNLQIEAGPTTTDYEPYENVCPIEGFDTIQVLRTNNSLMAGSFYNVNVGSHGLDAGGNQFSTLYARVKKGHSYVIVTADNNSVYGFIEELNIKSTSAFCKEYNNRIVGAVMVSSDGRKYQIITALINGWIAWRTTLDTVSDCAIYEGPRLLGDRSESQTLSINLVPFTGSMVYGGTITINEDGSGTLIVDRAVTILNNIDATMCSYSTTTHTFYLSPNIAPGMKIQPYTDAFTGICDRFESYPGTPTWDKTTVPYIGFGSAQNFRFSIPGTADVNEALPYINGCQVAYYLDSPVSYPLTATQLQTLVGTNHIWTNGASLELNYSSEKYGNVDKLLAAFPKETVIGNPVAFADGANDLPVESLIVSIEPKQDLNGYDKPWIGGAGKNLLPLLIEDTTRQGITSTRQKNGTVVFNGTQSNVDTFDMYFHRADGNNNFSTVTELPAGNYRFSGITDGSNSTYRLYVAIQESTIRYVGINSGYGEFTLSAPTKTVLFIRFYKGVTVNNLVVSPMIYAANAGNTFEPYENICPITGWDEVKVRRTGQNLYSKSNVSLNKNWINGDATGRAVIFFPIKSGVKYHYHLRYNGSNNVGLVYGENSAIGQSQTFSWNSGMSVNTLNEHTTTNIMAFFQFQWNEYGKSDSLSWSDIDDWEIIISETEIDIHDIPVSVKDSGSTLYGGTLNVSTGKLVVDRFHLHGSDCVWTNNGNYSNIFNGVFPNTFPAPATSHDAHARLSICSQYELHTSEDISNYQYGFALSVSGSRTIYVKNKDISSASEMSTQIAMADFVVAMNFPITYQLTPQEVSTLLGNNTFSCDAGKVSLEYRADPSLLINKLVSAMTAYGITV